MALRRQSCLERFKLCFTICGMENGIVGRSGEMRVLLVQPPEILGRFGGRVLRARARPARQRRKHSPAARRATPARGSASRIQIRNCVSPAAALPHGQARAGFELNGSHRLAADAAGNNELEVFEIGGDVEGKTVRGYAARNVHADGGDLALAILPSSLRPTCRPWSTRPSCLGCAEFQFDIARRCASAPLPVCGRNQPRRASE